METIEPRDIRMGVLDLAFSGNTVHIACAFSIAEILSVLYSGILRFPDNDPAHSNRDYFVLSKGHGVMAQYICFSKLGWLEPSDLSGYFKDGSSLPGLSESRIRGCEVSSGSLGHGLPVAAGLALASKLENSEQKTIVLVGDGEMNEGTNWEAMLFANHWRLDNLVVIVDKNGLQAMGRTDDVLSLGDLASKFESFGFDVSTVDGHDIESIRLNLKQALMTANGKPKALIANTTKGAGVSFMADENSWHYTRLDERTYTEAMAEVSGHN